MTPTVPDFQPSTGMMPASGEPKRIFEGAYAYRRVPLLLFTERPRAYAFSETRPSEDPEAVTLR